MRLYKGREQQLAAAEKAARVKVGASATSSQATIAVRIAGT
ncbi:hypothetical protein [Candidatus Ichthyocystis sparus]|nr:hypothetical protein [Candidatus Ichthyocystis sparus]